MNILQRRLSDKVYLTGIVFIGVSFIIFCLSLLWTKGYDAQFIFILNFALTGVYFFYRYFQKETVNAESKAHHRFLFLILSLISAFALNREMTVFENSANWFSGLLIILCLNYMAFAYFTIMPLWGKHLVSFMNGVGLMTFLYLSIYLLPLYVLSLPGMLLLGISYHSFVPLLFLVFTLLMQTRISRRNKSYWFSFLSGCMLITVISIIYILKWNSIIKQINDAWKEENTGLPQWVSVAQDIPHSSMAATVLKGDMVYSSPQTGGMFSLFDIPQRNIGESRKHDPLVLTALFFADPLQVDESSRVKILEINRDIRKQEVEDEDAGRLWSGDDLATNFVNTEVKVWPRCNIAYTEKTITVANQNDKPWNRSQEAIYTFYMPEGSVVTALSLWVNGKEEKGILTTKALADSSYKTIVGVQKRDPSVVHWQEGNSVTVRVFPVLAGEERTFKIGISSPLERINGKLRYENIYFKGPEANKAGEKTLIDFEQTVNDVQMPADFVSKIGQVYRKEGRYEPVWGIQVNDPGLSGCSFSFDGNTYTLAPYHKIVTPVDIKSVYLDINGSWTSDEFIHIVEATKDKTVFVYGSGLVKLDNNNAIRLWEKLHNRSFSFFPLFTITDVPHALLVTKNPPSVLGINDLKESRFMKKTKEFLSASDRINVFSLGDDRSLYIRTLLEFRLFRYDSGNVDILIRHLQKGQFPEDKEDDHRVIIHKTDMVIEKTTAEVESNGPDHVMRLFSYNHIMQKLGKGLLFDRPIEDSLVTEAREAYVVTPVSSMVVLEKQEDYDRFGIKDDMKGLGNATLKSNGAAPEPHEWVLIGIVIISLLFVIRKKQYRFSRS